MSSDPKTQTREALLARIQDEIDSCPLTANTEQLLRDCLVALSEPQSETVAYLMTNLQSGDIVATTDTEGFERTLWSKSPLVLADVLAAPGYYNAQQIKDSHRFFAYCPDIGAVWHETAEDAAQDAAMRIAGYRSAANGDGEWTADVEEVYWGELKGRAIAKIEANGTDYSLESVATTSTAVRTPGRENVRLRPTLWAFGQINPTMAQVEDGLTLLQQMWDYCDDITRNGRTFGATPGTMRAWSEALSVFEELAKKCAARGEPPRVPDSVVQTITAYGDGRADDNPLAATHLAAAITELRSWGESLMNKALA